MPCRCSVAGPGNTCVGINAPRLTINSISDLNDIELRGNGGCGGANAFDDSPNRNHQQGGDGGAGGGGLWIVSHGFDIENLEIDTSGLDGERGRSEQMNDPINGSIRAGGGSGAGGNAGRIVLVQDGGVATIGNARGFIVSRRGETPNNQNGCVGEAGDSNTNRDEIRLDVVRLNCTGA